MFLEPRYFRLDDLLRRPYRVGEPLGVVGGQLSATAPNGWGFPDSVRWRDSAPFGAWSLTLTVEGETIAPEGGFWRPSHVTRFGQEPHLGLQVVEDKFCTDDDTLVSVLHLRNPSNENVLVEIDLRWKLRESPYGVVGQASPAPDDLYVTLPGQAMRSFVFALTIAPTEAEARQRIARWGGGEPLADQVRQWDRWTEENVPRFDCSDPWLMRLYYHRWALRCQQRERASAVSRYENRRDDFTEGDFDQPRLSCAAWETFVVERVVGLQTNGTETETLEIAPDPTLGLTYFCLDTKTRDGRALTIIWDDPNTPDDAYNDGDKGLTIYLGQTRLYNQPSLTPAVALALPTPRCPIYQ